MKKLLKSSLFWILILSLASFTLVRTVIVVQNTDETEDTDTYNEEGTSTTGGRESVH